MEKLNPRCYDLWLDPGTTDTTVAAEYLKPFDARLMRCFPVSSRVNRPANDDAECSARVEVSQPQGSLFSQELCEDQTQNLRFSIWSGMKL
jgi:hypothetical protein